MSRNVYKTPSARGANNIVADAEIITGENPLRRAYGRNVKRALANHRYDAVRVYTLKERRIEGRKFADAAGKWTVIDTTTDRDEALAWVNG